MAVRQDPGDGCAGLSQAEMGTLLGLSAPSVNRAVKQLADKKLAWLLEPGVYATWSRYVAGDHQS